MMNEIDIVESTMSTDVGDTTANRFRYQWVCSAISCCALLDDKADIEEVFCEHHEDILLKRRDGKYIGVQVKTRDSTQPLWSASDEIVLKSFARFTVLNLQFPGQFCEFTFSTNHPMQSRRNGQDVCFLLDSIKSHANYDEVERTGQTFIKKIAKIAEASEDDTFESLKKVTASSSFPKLRDATVRLIGALSEVWSRAGEITYTKLDEAANKLINACANAASLSVLEILPAYLSLTSNGLERSVCEQIESKRFDRQKVETILLESLDDRFPLIRGENLLDDVCTTNKELLRKKLSAGGFSVVSTTFAEDLCDASDYAGMKLVQKYGKEIGLQKYNELKLKVQGDSARAFEQAKQAADPFGVQMLDNLRVEIKERVNSNEDLYGYTSGHLEGLAYTLTSQCKIAWSINRPWEER